MGAYTWIYVRTLPTVFVVYFLLLVNVSRSQQPELDVPPVTDVTSDYDEGTYMYYDYNMTMSDPLRQLRPGSDFCERKSKCSDEQFSFSWPMKNCYCDDLCRTFQDCCLGYAPLVKFDIPDSDLFECKVYPQIERRFGVLIVSKCSKKWSDDVLRNLCETDKPGNDMLLQLPVSENSTEILFKNMYCAYCNLRYNFNFWKPEVMCEDDLSYTENVSISSLPPNCDLNFLPPSRDTALKYRKCSTKNPISACPENLTGEMVGNQCENGSTSYVFAFKRTYKNQACAECHNVSTNDIYCEPNAGSVPYVTPDIGKKKSYSFRVLVDFNSVRGEMGKINEEKGLRFSEMCLDEELYDPFSEKCRHIYCVPPRVAVKGKCEMELVGYTVMMESLNTSSTNDRRMDSLSENCTLVKMEPTEYEIRNDTKLIVQSSGRVYENWEYYQLEKGLFICQYPVQPCESDCETSVAFQSDIIEGYVTLILLVISLTALAFNFFIYVCFPQLRNTPGKILMCLIVSLFLAQLFFLVSPHLEGDRTVCMVSAIIVHFFYMAAFCWMNVIALDLWITFSNQFITAGSNETSKRFIYFSLYAWVVPSIIVTFSVIIDNVNIDSDLKNFKPKYGDGACWMTSRNGVLLLFAGPLALFKIFDIIAFVNTARHIYKAKKHGSVARQSNDSCIFWINLKLSLVMGLTWVFAFVANFANETFIWYLFIVFNALQGVFIAVTFIFTRKVIRLISEKAHGFSSLTGKSGTLEISTSGKAKLSQNSTETKFSSIPPSEV